MFLKNHKNFEEMSTEVISGYFFLLSYFTKTKNSLTRKQKLDVNGKKA